MTTRGVTSVFAGFRFPREVIAVAVRWYLRYGLSYRDVEELLAERGASQCAQNVRYVACVAGSEGGKNLLLSSGLYGGSFRSRRTDHRG